MVPFPDGISKNWAADPSPVRSDTPLTFTSFKPMSTTTVCPLVMPGFFDHEKVFPAIVIEHDCIPSTPAVIVKIAGVDAVVERGECPELSVFDTARFRLEAAGMDPL